jgi:transposase-like protein
VIGPPDDDFDLDRDFPLGDGVAATTADVTCPHCGQEQEIALDPDGGENQWYVEDCTVCCRPWQVVVEYQRDGNANVYVTPLD